MDTTLIKSELKALILRFAKGPDKNSISLDLDNSISNVVIEECKSPIKSNNRLTDLDTQLSKELDLFLSAGDRGEYLQAAYRTIALELFYQQVLIARGAFQRHHLLTTKFVQMTC